MSTTSTSSATEPTSTKDLQDRADANFKRQIELEGYQEDYTARTNLQKAAHETLMAGLANIK